MENGRKEEGRKGGERGEADCFFFFSGGGKRFDSLSHSFKSVPAKNDLQLKFESISVSAI